MHPSTVRQQRPLPPAAAAELARLEAEVRQAAAPLARARLGLPRAVSAARLPMHPLSGHQQLPLPPAAAAELARLKAEVKQAAGPLARPRLGLPRAVSAARQAGNALRATPSPQILALGELDFDRRSLISVYLAGKKIEEVLQDVGYIRYLKSLPMDYFEAEIWNKFGKMSLPAAQRRKNLDWGSSKTRLYYCHVEIKDDDSIVTTIKGPYMPMSISLYVLCFGLFVLD